jgi:putative hydrolase of the HAD superfamily
MIKAIIFDYGGILTSAERLRYFAEDTAEKYKFSEKLFVDSFFEDWRKAITGQISSEDFWNRLSALLNIEPKTLHDEFQAYFPFNEEVLAFIKTLKKKHKLALLSNSLEDTLEERIEKYNLHDVFDVIVASYNTGIAKPEHEIYKKVLQKLKVKADECIYIDDSKRNLPPAEELGMKIILYRDLRQLKQELQALKVKI